MVIRRISLLLPGLLLLLGGVAWGAVPEPGAAPTQATWYQVGADGQPSINLYFFWSRRCPHCLRALPFVEELAREHPWIVLHSLEVSQSAENIARYQTMASWFGLEARTVPAFFFCGTMAEGFDLSSTSGAALRQALEACYAGVSAEVKQGAAEAPLPEVPARITVPLLGEIDPASLSLPALTVVIAGLDAFNPCAFFILLFLLSLLIHARSRARMLLIGGVFVLMSGVIYFLFMAAWLNVFLLIGQSHYITLGAGLIAVAVALINVKDYFWFKQGVSLSIPESAKPGLFARMRGLLRADNMASMLVGTIVLAVIANMYELLCTAGFPMVFTRILTLNELPAAGYYLYLVLYNVVYVLPLILIVAAFTLTLGARKLSEEGGRRLKLLSGVMMLELGIVLLAAPEVLDNVLTAFALLAGALAVTGLIVALDAWRRRTAGAA